MMRPRMAGTGALPDGRRVTWTVAEGRRGRRWREVVVHGPHAIHALLLETDPERRFSHLELARADGLWTFHPEPDGTLHGNHVGLGEGIHHVDGWAFSPDDILLIEGSPLSRAAIAWARGTTMRASSVAEVAGVIVRPDSELDQISAIRIERLDDGRWQVGEGSTFEIDQAGLPVLDHGVSEPLELA
jgi:hypothetical protein